MSVLSFVMDYTGQVGILPRRGTLICNDPIDTVTQAGYLNQNLGAQVSGQNGDFVFCNYGASSTTAGIFNISISSGIYTLVPYTGDPVEGFVLLDPPGDQTIINGFLIVSNGALQSGVNGSEGFLIVYPPDLDSGALQITTDSNSGNTLTTLQFSSMGQTSAIVIPDPGVASANAILSNSAGSAAQEIHSPLTITNGYDISAIDNGNIFTVGTGVISANGGAVYSGQGTGGFAGEFTAYSPTSGMGALSLKAADNNGNSGTISNHALTQDTTYFISDIGDSGNDTGHFLISSSAVDPIANVNPYYAPVAVDYTEVASGGSQIIFNASAAAQYTIIGISIAPGSGNFSGGGGDRDLIITDGTNIYTTIPAATLQAIQNAFWGSAAVPATDDPIYTLTVAGQNLVAKYANGTTDYTSGQIVVNVFYARIL